MRDNGAMRLLLVAVLAAVAASSASASRSLVFTVKTKQGPTVAHAHPPAGGVGDSYDSSLALANAGLPQLGRPARASVGTMQFTYTIRKQCTSFSPKCVATADFTTVTTLPGGTVKAAGKSISIAQPGDRDPRHRRHGPLQGCAGNGFDQPDIREAEHVSPAAPIEADQSS